MQNRLRGYFQSTCAGCFDSLRATVQGIRSCRLCWRITLGVFLVFMVAELAVLAVSADRYEKDQYLILEREALVVARTILRSAEDPNADAGFDQLGADLRQNSALVGMEKFSTTGISMGRFGEPATVRPDITEFSEETRRTVLDGNDRMEVVWPPNRVHAPYFVSAQIDISSVDGLVDAYIQRILGLILLLAAVTTIATMLLLDVLVLRPIRALDSGLKRMADDPMHPNLSGLEVVGKDELGDVARNFQALSARLHAALAEVMEKNNSLIAAARAEEANRAKTDFLANMSHDLRTPLNAILGFSSIIREGTFGPIKNDRYAAYVENIHESGQNLLGLVDRMLDLARIESGDIDLREAWIDLDHELERAKKRCAMAFDADALPRIQVTVDPSLGRLFGDPSRIASILDNLIGNALSHGGPNVQIQCSWQADRDGNGILRIADDGAGIPKDQLAGIFEPFRQGGSDYDRRSKHRRASSGNGLGLTIVQKLADLHDARVSMRSDSGVGTRIMITFPADRIDVPTLGIQNLPMPTAPSAA